jgi:hypothetical protein
MNRENKPNMKSNPISDTAIRMIISRIHKANFKNFQATSAMTIKAIRASQIGMEIVIISSSQIITLAS